MSKRAYLYRRNGTYYFRWSIPLACRLRMPSGSPTEVRVSLRTSQGSAARHGAARLWLSALDVAQALLVSVRPFGYNDLVGAIQGRAGMENGKDDEAATFASLGEIAGTTDVQALRDALAALERVGAKFHVAVPLTSVAIWSHAYDESGELKPVLIEHVEDFVDDQAFLTPAGIVSALAAERNLISLQTAYSNQPGMWEGTADRKTFRELRLTPPLQCNLSSLRVEARFAKALPAPVLKASPTQAPAPPDCAPIALTQALPKWSEDNADWTKSTKDNYQATLRQFIEIVGDKKTTELTPSDFDDYAAVLKALPSNWKTEQTKTGKTIRKLAADAPTSATKLSKKSLKDKGSTLALFFKYLTDKGYWHGRFGHRVFSTVRDNERKIPKHVFSDADLKAIFAGKGLDILAKAKFPLYVWGSLLLLYTGARPGEISQLLRRDVIQEPDGPWYLRITEGDDDDASGKQIKTSSSDRSVPLHQALIDLGFLSYLDGLQPNDPLFPEATRHAKKVSREICDWFNQKLLPAAELKAPGVSIYGLRHTAINRFKADSTLDHFACAYTGHATNEDKVAANKIYVDQYGRAHAPKTLAEKLHPLLKFGIDFSALKGIIGERKSAWATEHRKLTGKSGKSSPKSKPTERTRKSTKS